MKFALYYRVVLGGKTRFESLFVELAQEHARKIYRATKAIAEIYEVAR